MEAKILLFKFKYSSAIAKYSKEIFVVIISLSPGTRNEYSLWQEENENIAEKTKTAEKNLYFFKTKMYLYIETRKRLKKLFVYLYYNRNNDL